MESIAREIQEDSSPQKPDLPFGHCLGIDADLIDQAIEIGCGQSSDSDGCPSKGSSLAISIEHSTTRT